MRIYTYSISKKIGATQQERLGQRIRELKFDGDITYKVVAYHGDDEIGYVEGDGSDNFRILIKFLFKEYNVSKFDNIEQFYGACYVNFTERPPMREGDSVVTFKDYMTNNGFTVDDTKYLDYTKAYKHFLLKSDIRAQLNDNGDSIADIIKIMMLKFYWYDTLIAADKVIVDNQFSILSTIYNEESCKSALASMVNDKSTLELYYANKNNLYNADEYSIIMQM